MNRPTPTDRSRRILAEGPDRTRVVIVDGPYTEMMAPNAETGWTQQLAKLERL